MTAAQAQVQPPCTSHDKALAQLAEKYREVPVAGGLSSQGTMVEVLVSPSGSWTILVTTAAGRSCLVAAGEGWRAFEPAPVKLKDTGA